jgi:hypothetical protein
VQSGVDEPFVAGAHGGERCHQITIVKAAVGTSSFGEGVTKAHEQMLALVSELLGDFDLPEQRGGVELLCRRRLLVFASLLQIGAGARTI